MEPGLCGLVLALLVPASAEWCYESLWPDVDNGMVCGECKVSFVTVVFNVLRPW
jgi:hypothetical protein